MAADLLEAVENFKATARYFKAIIELADELEKIGNLQRATNEAQGLLDSRRAEIAALEAAAAEEQTEASTVLADARAEAASILSSAKAQAEAEAKTVRDSAKRDADRLVAAAEAQKAEIVEHSTAAATRAEQFEARVTTATAALAALETKIAAARATMAQMLQE